MQIYCDGSCIGNPGPGGWAAILIKENIIVKKVYGFTNYTTNNKMELTAAIQALKVIQEIQSLQIFTDSNYLKLGITQWIKNWSTNNWKNGKIKNIDLWQELYSLVKRQTTSWFWVKAHDGNQYNEIVDKLARKAALKKISKS